MLQLEIAPDNAVADHLDRSAFGYRVELVRKVESEYCSLKRHLLQDTAKI